jgi:2-polyprenyl-3-methyl-5-hydroxy-6-metoxy-1,4-benzoquinol methylase
VRFRIIPEEFLLCIDQHLPNSGRVLDLGCGFGLFTLWFAHRRPECQFVGIDSSARRIRAARELAETLQVRNVTFECQDIVLCQTGSINAAYCIDLLHHIPPAAGERLLRRLFEQLEPEGKVVVKDITTRPRGGLYFTYVLDFLVSPKDTFYYRDAALWSALLGVIGFKSLYWHRLRNALPYPHFLLVGSKPLLPSLD